MYKKGQIEDFFSDLIPAIVVVVIALVIVSVVGARHDNSVKVSFESDMARLSASDLNTLMRAPSMLEGYDNMAEVFVLLSEAANDKESWVWDNGLLKEDGYVLCDGELYDYLNDYFSAYHDWSLNVGEVRCWKDKESTPSYLGADISSEIKGTVLSSEILIPTGNPSKPLRASLTGKVEVGK